MVNVFIFVPVVFILNTFSSLLAAKKYASQSVFEAAYIRHVLNKTQTVPFIRAYKECLS